MSSRVTADLLEIAPGLLVFKPSKAGLERGSPEYRKAASAGAIYRQWHRRREVIDYLGGRCTRCGWSGHIGCYHVHHTDPSTKTTRRGTDTVFCSGGTSRAWLTDEEKRELDTCELLCGNCHSLEHVGSVNPYLRYIDAASATFGQWDQAWNGRVPSKEVRG